MDGTEPQGSGNEPVYIHTVRVRYGECDMQGVVFNANYLAYIDDGIGQWFNTALGPNSFDYFDCMVKKSELEWFAPAKPGDTLSLAFRASRWGTTSFDVAVDGFVGEQPIIASRLVYVSVTPGTHTPCAVPDRVKGALSERLGVGEG